MDEITFLQDDCATRRFPTYSALIQREDIHGAIFIMLSKMFKDVKHLFFNYCFCKRRPYSCQQDGSYEVTA